MPEPAAPEPAAPEPVSPRPPEPGPRASTLAWAACIGIAVVGILARYLRTNWQPAVIAAVFSIHLLVFAVVAVVIALLARRRSLLLIGVVVLVLGLAMQVPLFLGEQVPAGGADLSMMQSNLRLGGADAEALTARIIDENVDIMTTEELTPQEVVRLKATGIDALLPYQYLAPLPQASGVGIWSKYPLVGEQKHPGFELQAISARVRLPGGIEPTVFAVHVLAPYPGLPTDWSSDLRRLHGVLTAAARSGGSVIAAGDYNSTYDQANFRALLDDGYRDAGEQSGAGILATYPDDEWYPPQIGIDHMLVKGARALGVRSMTVPGSDHRCLVARIRVSAGSSR